MKVLLSGGMIQGGRSGVGRYVICLAEALVAEHPEVELHIAGLDEDRALFPFIRDDRWLTIPPRFARGPFNLLWHQAMLPKLLEQGGYDVVHIPSYRRMLAFSPIPQVATIHDCAPFVLRGKYDMFRGFFGRGMVPAIARKVPRIIAVSETTRQDIIRFMKVPGERIVTVPNGIDHAMFKLQDPAEIAAFRQRKNLSKPYLLYVARLEHPAKNHVRLIEAFGKLAASGKFSGSWCCPALPGMARR